MKFEVELDKNEIEKAVKESLARAYFEMARSYASEQHIKARLKEMWNIHVDEVIAGALANRNVIEEKVNAEIERKLRNRLSAAMKAADK